MVKISKKEYETLKSLGERWIWIARDSGDDYIGQLFAYLEKPIKSYDVGCWRDYDGGGFSSTDSYLFQFIQWSDSEPYNIAELIRGYEWAQLNEKYPPVGESEETEVKRDKEDLVKYLEKEISNFKPGEMIYDYLTFILKQLKQLDEPEVLSKEWIDDNTWNNHYVGKLFVYVEDLKNKIVPKQELPAIPKFVADHIEEVKSSGDSLDDAYALLRGIYRQSEVADWMAENKKNSELFARAWLDGYTVEEEQKYYARIKGWELLEGKADWIVPTYWYLDTTNGNMFISDRITVLDKYLIKASKSEWNKLGINNSNADFILVEELEE